MIKVKQELDLLKRYSVLEWIKALCTAFVFFIFPTLIIVGLLITFGTIYPYWNMIFLVIGSIGVFLYGFWTSKVMIETLNVYQPLTLSNSILLYGISQTILLISILIVDRIIITTIF